MLLQSGARDITKWSRYEKCDNYYKIGQYSYTPICLLFVDQNNYAPLNKKTVENIKFETVTCDIPFERKFYDELNVKCKISII